ncbi:MAG: PKD domain-containing protein, partial [Flavobacteriales bacterium]|nr:PKD domain-containing protein [Flavobacteriales bacterium]
EPIGNSTVYDCYLFDWKQSIQGVAQEGFALSKISGNIPAANNNTYFWAHTNDSLSQVLATDYGAGKGWVDFTTHQVELIYTSSQIRISVDGNLIFDVPGCYDPGRFGFYNFSQADVTYADFDYEMSANYNLITPQICADDTGLFQFVDTTCSGIPVNIASWLWNFGDGNFSTQMNPTHAYATSGTFPVQMIITDGAGCSDSVTKNIIIESEPLANFTSSQECFGDTTVFTDGTILTGGGAIVSWAWNFGDGNTSTVQNPSNLYASVGTYSSFLAVITDSGCTDSITITTPVFEVPVAGFTTGDVCYTDTTFFNSSSSISTGTISWAWDFDDGNISTEENPYHIYAAAGTYDVELVVTSDNFCTDTFVLLGVQIFPEPIASFSVQSVCFGSNSDFIDLSTLATGYIWSFGDNSPDYNGTNPSYLYADPGSFSYNTSLTVTTSNGCTDDTTVVVLVHPNPVANFSSDTVCLNFSTSFTNNSTITNGEDIDTYWWDFGDLSGTSTIEIPSYTYTTPGTFDVMLYVVSDSGCTHDTLITIIVDPLPTASFTSIPDCPNFPTYFFDASSSDVVSWVWDFDGEGTSALASPTHTFNSTGTYDVRLIVKNNKGCLHTVNINAESRPEPVAGFTVNPDTTTNVTPFIDFFYAASGATSYIWNMGNDTSFTTFSDTNFTFIYSEEDTATYLVQQIAINDFGCRDTFEFPVQIREDFTIFFPNTITPNGDGINETFLPLGIGLLSNVKKYNLSIFNRWGDIVFETNDIHQGWDGRANDGSDQTQSTVYVWFVEMDVFGLGKHQAIGHLTLLR